MINQDLIKINGVKPPKVKGYTVSREKLWADASRNLKGELKATLIGIFPKITVEFAPTTTSQMSTIIALLDPASVTVQWYDEKTDSVKSGAFYAGDWQIPLLSKQKGLYEAFSVNLIAYVKI